MLEERHGGQGLYDISHILQTEVYLIPVGAKRLPFGGVEILFFKSLLFFPTASNTSSSSSSYEESSLLPFHHRQAWDLHRKDQTDLTYLFEKSTLAWNKTSCGFCLLLSSLKVKIGSFPQKKVGNRFLNIGDIKEFSYCWYSIIGIPILLHSRELSMGTTSGWGWQ